MARRERLKLGEPAAINRQQRSVAHWLMPVTAAAMILAILFAGIGYRIAIATPTERHLNLRIDPQAARHQSLRLILISDVHVHGPDMPPERLLKIVDQINEQHPDVVIAAGDFLGNNLVGANYSIEDSVGPLAALRPRFATFAVLGNNDHVADGKKVMRALKAVHVHVLKNAAVKVGPIVLGGVDYHLDTAPSKAVLAVYKTLAQMRQLQGLQVLVAHSPDVFPSVPSSVSLVLAGHTHCGQVSLPLIGPLETGSRYGREFVCGLYRRGDSALVVTAGLGTSHVPIRFGASPDFWVIDIEAPQSSPKGPVSGSSSVP